MVYKILSELGKKKRNVIKNKEGNREGPKIKRILFSSISKLKMIKLY